MTLEYGGKDIDLNQYPGKILFDTVAIYLALNTKFVQMETVPLLIDNEGLTRTDPNGKPVRCALEWKNLPAYKTFLTLRLLGKK